jgi:hypothetical protein
MYIADYSLYWAQSLYLLGGPADQYINGSHLLAQNTGFDSKMFLIETEETNITFPVVRNITSCSRLLAPSLGQIKKSDFVIEKTAGSCRLQ